MLLVKKTFTPECDSEEENRILEYIRRRDEDVDDDSDNNDGDIDDDDDGGDNDSNVNDHRNDNEEQNESHLSANIQHVKGYDYLIFGSLT